MDFVACIAGSDGGACAHGNAGELGQDQLSVCESRVLCGVLEGQSNKEIGALLEVTESSVKAVFQKLFERARVRSRSQLVRYAIEPRIAHRS